MSLERRFIALQNKIERTVKHKEATVAKNYKKIYNDLKISMARLYEKYEVNGQLTYDEMAKYNRIQKLDKEVQDLMTKLYANNSKVIRGTLRGIGNDTQASTFNIINKRVVRKLKAIKKDIDVTKTINDKMAGLHWSDRQKKHRSDLIYSIQKEIKQGLTKGDSYSTMSKRLKKELETDLNKSKLVIRTESNRVFNQTKLDSLERISSQGIEFTKTWRSGQDERVRSAHNKLDGTTIPLDKEFTSPNGGVGKAPGLMGNASDDCYCRCILIPNIVTD